MCDQQRLRSAQSVHSLCQSLEYSMSVKLLTDHHLEFLRLKGGCTGSPESTLVKIPHCWKSHVMAHFWCLVIDSVLCLLPMVPWVGLQCVIVVFSDQTHSLI